MKYEVQQYTLCGGWTNTWKISDENGIEQPEVFDSEEEAQAELDAFFQEVEEEIQDGEGGVDEAYDRSDFRIVLVVTYELITNIC